MWQDYNDALSDENGKWLLTINFDEDDPEIN